MDSSIHRNGHLPQQVSPILRAAQQHFHGSSSTSPEVAGTAQSQRGRPRAGTMASSTSRRSSGGRAAPSRNDRSSSNGMMRFVDSVMSPFVHCWQPPLDACAGVEMNMPLNNYSCGGDAVCADMPACASSNKNNNQSRRPATNTRPVPQLAVQTVTPEASRPAAMVTPMAMATTACHHHPPYHHHRQSSSAHDLSLAPSCPSSSRCFDYSNRTKQQHLLVQSPPPPVLKQRGNIALTDIESPTPTDVLCGRGGSSNRHNKLFRELICANKGIYSSLTKKQKMLLSRQVVDTIHQAGGRFLSKDTTTGKWNDIGLPRSLEKASQALREKTTNTATSSGGGKKNMNADYEAITTEAATTIAMMKETTENVNPPATTELNAPRTTSSSVPEAPSLIIPLHVQHVYRPNIAATQLSASPASPHNTTSNGDPGWIAEFAPASDHPVWVAEFSSPDPSPSADHGHHATVVPPNANANNSTDAYPRNHQQQQTTAPVDFHPSDSSRPMPPPHRGAYPFSARQMSRIHRQSSSTPVMVSPVQTYNHPHQTMSWQPQTPTLSPSSRVTSSSTTTPATTTATTARRSWEATGGQPHHYRPSPHTCQVPTHPPDYVSSATTSSNFDSSTVVPPGLHHYSEEIHNRRLQQQQQQGSPTTTLAATHPQPPRDQSPELKRQRTHEEENTYNDGENNNLDDREQAEEDVILFVDDPDNGKAFSLQDTSLTEGSQQLPAEVESKLSLQEKVISPSCMQQTSRSLRPRSTLSRRLNTSAEEEGLAGLAALSTAAFLRLDEGE